MRALALALIFGLAWPAALAGSAQVEAYLGTTTRDPLFGPAVLCEGPDGRGVGGVCFDIIPGESRHATIIVHDDLVPDTVRVPLIMYTYGPDIVGLPLDGDVECPVNHGAVTLDLDRFATRVVIGVGQWAMAVRACPGLVGTQGTIEFHPWIDGQK